MSNLKFKIDRIVKYNILYLRLFYLIFRYIILFTSTLHHNYKVCEIKL